MTIYESARPFPVLGREGDYKEAVFLKSMLLSSDGFTLRVTNKPNLVNELCGERVGDYLLIENRTTATKKFIPLDENELEINLPLAELWGVTSLTILQISIEALELVDEDQDLFDDFFKYEGGTVFEIRPGEVLGFGEAQYVNVSGSTGSNWIQFDKNEDSDFEYRVSTGVTGNIVVHLGKELYSAAMLAMASPESRYWATLSLAKPGVEFAIRTVLSGGNEEIDERPDWFEGLALRLSGLGVHDEEDIQELTELQHISMKILESEVLAPLVELLRQSQTEER
jgi:hypothetical protein